MPSDAKKKQLQKKKEAAKARQAGRKPQQKNGENGGAGAAGDKESSPSLFNGVEKENGVSAMSAEGKFNRDKLFIAILFQRCH